MSLIEWVPAKELHGGSWEQLELAGLESLGGWFGRDLYGAEGQFLLTLYRDPLTELRRARLIRVQGPKIYPVEDLQLNDAAEFLGIRSWDSRNMSNGGREILEISP